jgi:hypothetical protein
MSRSAILVAAVALFCILPASQASAQRERPRNSIIKRDTAARATAATGSDSAALAKLSATLAPGTGSIMGAVIDSLDSSMLDGAVVSVMGMPARRATTTGAGVFRIDSVPPGRYVLRLSHPILDSLGIQVHSDSITVTESRVQPVEMAIPSAHTVTAMVCSPAKLRFGPAVILGRVIDAGTHGPATGAEISVAWKETVINNVVGLQIGPRVRKATVEPDGTYRICGVPSTLSGTLQAIRGGAQTAEVPIELTDQPLAMATLFLPPEVAAADSAGSGNSSIPRAVITGTVTNAGGVAVSGARVSVQGSNSSVSTGEDGKFTLTGVLPGTQSVLVRRVGYEPVEQPLNVAAGRPNELTVHLGTFKTTLSTVAVEAKADPLKDTGFERRRKMGMGRYLDYDQIKAAQPTFTSDILRRVPGLRVLGSGTSATVTTVRPNGCLRVMIDGNAVSVDGQSIDQIVGAQDVVAVEFYNPVDVPIELSSGASNGCALVELWTKAKWKDPAK